MTEPVYTDSTIRSSEELSSSYLNLLYAVLFHPVQTFKILAADKEPSQRILLYALLSVVLVSAAMPIIHFAGVGAKAASLAIAIPASTVMGIFVWAFVALVIGMLSYAFSSQTRYRTLLVLSGLALLPWLLMAPVSLLKVGLGAIGAILCAVFGLTIWLWTILLFAVAIVITYAMTAERVMIILAMPFVMTLIFFGWIFGFFNNISSLVPH